VVCLRRRQLGRRAEVASARIKERHFLGIRILPLSVQRLAIDCRSNLGGVCTSSAVQTCHLLMEMILFRVATALVEQGYEVVAFNSWQCDAALKGYHLFGRIRVDTTVKVA